MPNHTVDRRAAREEQINRFARAHAKAARWLREHGAHDHARTLVAQAIATVDAFRAGKLDRLPRY